MFKKENRVPGQIKFNNARRYSTSLFTVKTKDNELKLNRFAIVVSKNIYKKSTARNKAKRLLRSVIEKIEMKKEEGKDILIIVKGDVLKAVKGDLAKHLNEVLSGGHTK